MLGSKLIQADDSLHADRPDRARSLTQAHGSTLSGVSAILRDGHASPCQPHGSTLSRASVLLRLLLCLILMIIFILGSCRLNYGADVEAEGLEEGVPNVEIFGFVQQIYRDGRLILELEAETSRAYESRNLRELLGVSFREFDASGELAASGRADKALLFTDTENVELSGSIEVYSAKEGASVVGDYFYWDSEDKTITALAEEMVRILTDEGEVIEGRGFNADMRRRVLGFTRGVEGQVGSED